MIWVRGKDGMDRPNSPSPFPCGRCKVSCLINQGCLVAWVVHSLSIARLNSWQTFDPAAHPADTTLSWVECEGILSCAAGAALLQPVITCAGEARRISIGARIVTR